MTALHEMQRQLRAVDPVLRSGRVRRIMSSAIEADGPNVPLGTLCEVQRRGGTAWFGAEVVHVDRESVILSPFEDGAATFSGAAVRASARADLVPVGPALLGRAVDALARPCDGAGAVQSREFAALHEPMPSPLDRVSPREVLETGVRAIDGLLTLGIGQRVGIFAASGVGKTSLVTQLAQQVEADIVVIALIGERGREVEAIWNGTFSGDRRAKAILVAATSDQSAAMRVRAVHLALAQAHYWRGRGRKVLLLLDSATRLAMALREIGLAAGEPPTVRAYTPNVFAVIPRIVERCGALKDGGAITAVVTVLSETDEIDDPVCEMMKSLLDGHVVLARSLAEQGHFPAIDVCKSVSRQSWDLAGESHRVHALQVLEWLSLQHSARTLLDTGLYAKGANPKIDRAVELHPAILRFLKQGREERSGFAKTVSLLSALNEGRGHA